MRQGGWAGTSRFCAAAFVADCIDYLTYTSVPLKAIALGGGPLILGLLPALSSTVYIVAALRFGSLAHPGRRMKMARLGVLFLIIGAFLLRLASRIEHLFLFLPLVPIGAALFWPAIQAELGERGESASLGGRIGWFNVSWSSGKMLGFLTAGHLAQRFGTGAPLALAIALGAILFLLAPADRPGPATGGAVRVEEGGADAQARRRYRLAAWGANLAAYGAIATLIYQFPKKVLALGLKEGNLGNFLALVQLTQTVTFVCLGTRRGWHYRRAALILPLLVGMISVASIALWNGAGWIFACAPGIGIALGFAYSSSLFHSLHREEDRGRFTGIHEAVLGSGGFFIPLLGGALASRAGLDAPYVLCAVAFAGAAAVAALLLSRGTTPQRSPGSSQVAG